MSDNEVLVVASKIKKYIKDRGDMKTSASVLEALSDKLRALCNEAIENARNDGRKTVLDRDFS
jgi:histone H3/H4